MKQQSVESLRNLALVAGGNVGWWCSALLNLQDWIYVALLIPSLIAFVWALKKLAPIDSYLEKCATLAHPIFKDLVKEKDVTVIFTHKGNSTYSARIITEEKHHD